MPTGRYPEDLPLTLQDFHDVGFDAILENSEIEYLSAFSNALDRTLPLYLPIYV